MTFLTCPGRLELPKDKWVLCDQPAGHGGKHTGPLDSRRYWWTAEFARARSLRKREGGNP